MENLISFAIGERWSPSIFKCIKCEDGWMHEDKLHTQIAGVENRYFKCDKCGYETKEGT